MHSAVPSVTECSTVFHLALPFPTTHSSEALDVLQAQLNTERRRAEKMSADLIWLRDKFSPEGKKNRNQPASMSVAMKLRSNSWNDAACLRKIRKTFRKTDLQPHIHVSVSLRRVRPGYWVPGSQCLFLSVRWKLRANTWRHLKSKSSTLWSGFHLFSCSIRLSVIKLKDLITWVV